MKSFFKGFFTLIFTAQLIADIHSPFEIIYHGSPTLFERVEPKTCIKSRSNDTPAWEGTAIFGSVDKRIALFYTHTRVTGYTADINLDHPIAHSEAVTYEITGGASLEAAIDALWGPLDDNEEATGYLYLLDGRHFKSEPGLGEMERVCRHSHCNIGKVPVHRRRELEHYRSLGLIKFNLMRP